MRQAGLGAVERLDLALLVDRQHDGVGRRIDVEADDVAQLGDELGSLDSLNWRTRCGARPCARQMRCTEETLIPAALAMAAAVQCVASPGGSLGGQRDDPLDHLRPERRHARGPRLVAQQPVDARLA